MSADGTAANGDSSAPAISADGRYVTFVSFATNLVEGDTNGVADVFVHDRQTGDTVLVSHTVDGGLGNGAAADPAISADGQSIAFESTADNLVIGDDNGTRDIFLWDRESDTTQLISVSSGGEKADDSSGDPAISGDGQVVVFHSLATNLVSGDTNGKGDIFSHDIATGLTERISRSASGALGLKSSDHPAVSADGRWIVYDSDAANLVTGDTNSCRDIFLYDRLSATVERLSLGKGGVEGDEDSTRPAISADGRYVGYQSAASALDDDNANTVMNVLRIGPLWSDDTDGDGIPDDGDLSGVAGDSPCQAGQTRICDDNCRATANAGQTDADDDGYGNRCDCDLNNDGLVGQADFIDFQKNWGANGGLADFNADGTVGQVDFIILRERWGDQEPFE